MVGLPECFYEKDGFYEDFLRTRVRNVQRSVYFPDDGVSIEDVLDLLGEIEVYCTKNGIDFSEW